MTEAVTCTDTETGAVLYRETVTGDPDLFPRKRRRIRDRVAAEHGLPPERVAVDSAYVADDAAA